MPKSKTAYRILSIVKANHYPDENFLKQIPQEFWNDEIIIAACCDDEDSIDFYFKDHWKTVNLELIEKLINAFRKYHQIKKVSCLVKLFQNLGGLDSWLSYKRKYKLKGNLFEIPEAIWMSGCKYCPCVVDFFPDRYLTKEVLDIAKSAGGVTFDASRFACATPEDVCLYCDDIYVISAEEIGKENYDSFLYMRNIIQMETEGLINIGNPFSEVEEHYFTKPENPVGRMSLTNRVLPALLFKCFEKTQAFRPPRLEIGEALSKYIRHRFDTFDMESDIFPVSQEFFLPVRGRRNFYGNRSFVFQKNNDRFFYCKFLRKGEDVKELVREISVHDFIYKNKNNNKDGSNLALFVGKLKSETLRPEGIFKISEGCEISSEIVSQFSDDIEKNDQNYLIFYCFSSDTEKYSQYALVANSAEERDMAEVGIIKGAYDLGFWGSAGVFHNSIIPVFHSYDSYNPESSRAWNICHSKTEVFIYNKICSLPGKMKSWRNAIRKPDLSSGGLRDLGDFVVFNKNAENLQKEIMEMVKVIGKNFVALGLIWCELNRNVLKEEALKKFIITMLDCFIDGYFASLSETYNAKMLLDFSPDTYEKSLAMAAHEMFFWLIHKQGSLTEAGDLYPEERDEFSQGDDLGVDEGLFPCTVLIKLITRLCTGIVEFSSIR